MKFAGTVEQEKAAAIAAGSPVAFVSAGDNISASLFASAVAAGPADDRRAQRARAQRVGGRQPRVRQGLRRPHGPRDRDASANWDYLGANVYLKGTTTPALAGVHDPRHGRRQGRRHRRGHGGDPVAGQPRRHHRRSTSATRSTRSTASPRSSATATRPTARPTCSSPSTTRAPARALPERRPSSRRSPQGGAFADIVDEDRGERRRDLHGPHPQAVRVGRSGPGRARQDPADPADGLLRRVHRQGRADVRPEHRRGHRAHAEERAALVAPVVAGNTPAQNEAAFAAALVAAYPRVAQVKTIVERGARVRRTRSARSRSVGHGRHHDGLHRRHVRTDGLHGRGDRARRPRERVDARRPRRQRAAGHPRAGEPRWRRDRRRQPGRSARRAALRAGRRHHHAEANGVLPFVNNLWTTSLTGAQFKTMLEQQWQTNADGTVPSRPYLQLGLSDNVTYTYDAARAAGSHITSVTVNGAADRPGRELPDRHVLVPAPRAATTSASCAAGPTPRDSGLVDRDGWIAYLQAHPGLDAGLRPPARSACRRVPTSVTAGDTLAFPVTKLDLTSLGSPLEHQPGRPARRHVDRHGDRQRRATPTCR